LKTFAMSAAADVAKAQTCFVAATSPGVSAGVGRAVPDTMVETVGVGTGETGRAGSPLHAAPARTPTVAADNASTRRIEGPSVTP
jgi:hypothetical protein